jgi:hypothetical protein
VTRLFLSAMPGHYCAKAETSKADNPLLGKLPFAASSFRPHQHRGCNLCICELLLVLEKQDGPSCCTADNLTGALGQVKHFACPCCGF